ncbi:imelysin family protein [Rhizobium paknamense]|uniref:Lipoprotein n=1 Tax=Rhizobium paknamense TaxID=1206817 RepID=A0ABU0ICE9_9HYPH|nr:imelysin family protein [Rhizobium paknamense]MDQ0455347.1 putative lipoprotein [Rhizobium paknamense]
MKAFLSLIAALAVLPAIAFAEDAEPHHAAGLQLDAVPAVMTRVVDGFIRPGYHEAHDKAEALAARLKQSCASPSPEGLEAARQDYRAAVLAWSRIEIVRTGPVIEENRFEHILFYPDRKGLALKQIQGAIASKDESFTRSEALRQKSVAIQGLGALDYVLYGTGAEQLATPEGQFRCLYATAIAGNVAAMTGELASLWDQPDGIGKAWTEPGPQNDVFRDGPEAVTGLLGILVHGAETLRDERIETFYKGGNGRIAPKQAIYWRSGLTFASMRANLQGLHDLLNGAGVKDLMPEDKRAAVEKVNQMSAALDTLLAGLPQDPEKATTDPAARASLDQLLAQSRDMITALSDGVGGAVGLTAGFSFADGD